MIVPYLLQAFIERLWRFVGHWYIHSFMYVFGKLINVLGELDKTFALRITLRNWKKPLYQDYTILGFILGFILRTVRIFVATLVYLIVFLFFAAIYLIWAAFPIAIFFRNKVEIPFF